MSSSVPAPARHHAAQRLAAEQEAAHAADAPAGLEVFGLHFQRVARHVVAGVEDGEVDRALRFGRLDGRRLTEASSVVSATTAVACTAGCADRVRDRCHLGLGAAADEDVEPFARRHAADRRAQPFARTHTDHDRRLAHAALPFRLKPGPRRAPGEYSVTPARNMFPRKCIGPAGQRIRARPSSVVARTSAAATRGRLRSFMPHERNGLFDRPRHGSNAGDWYAIARDDHVLAGLCAGQSDVRTARSRR